MKQFCLYLVVFSMFTLGLWSCQDKQNAAYAPSRDKKTESVVSSGTTSSMSAPTSQSGNMDNTSNMSEKVASSATSKPNFDKMSDSVRSSPDGVVSPAKREGRKVIRTADVGCEVANVEKSTLEVEKLTKQFGGFVSSTDLSSNNMDSKETPVGLDSVLRVTRYRVENKMVIRVPNVRLDTVLELYSKVWAHLKYRKISSEDVTLQMKTNELQEQNNRVIQQRIRNATDEKGRKLNDIVEAETKAGELGSSMIEQRMQNLGLNERISYSTINLEMEQFGMVEKMVVANTSLDRYSPGFFHSAWASFTDGFEFVGLLIVATLRLWPLILIAIGLWWGVRKWRNRKL
jgi:Domain of unknown function (DUF4349)